MKLFFFMAFGFVFFHSFCQESSFNQFDFKKTKIEPTFFSNENNLSNLFRLETEINPTTFLLLEKNRYNNLKTKIEFEKIPNLKIEQKINYDKMFFGCPPGNSRDMMVSSIKIMC